MSQSPPAIEDVETKSSAIAALQAHRGSTILHADYARKIAAQFDTDIEANLQPISRMDRLQPDNDDLGIGVGTLCRALVEDMDGEDPVDGDASGHGRYQCELKNRNLPKIEASA